MDPMSVERAVTRKLGIHRRYDLAVPLLNHWAYFTPTLYVE